MTIARVSALGRGRRRGAHGSNVAKATVRRCWRPASASAVLRVTTPSSYRQRRQDRHRGGQRAVLASWPSSYQDELSAYGVDMRDPADDTEGFATLRALADDNSGHHARASSRVAWSAACRGAWPPRSKGPARRILQAALGGAAVPRAGLGLHARRPADHDPARPQGQAHPDRHARQRRAAHRQAAAARQRHQHEEIATFIDEDLAADAARSWTGRPMPPSSSLPADTDKIQALAARAEHPADGLHAGGATPTPIASRR